MATEVTELVETEVEGKTQMYLLSALSKDGAAALDELAKIISSAGLKVAKSEDLGVRKLAFSINGNRELSLVSVFFSADPASLKNVQNELTHADLIERFLLTTWRASLDEPKRKTGEYSSRKTESVNV